MAAKRPDTDRVLFFIKELLEILVEPPSPFTLKNPVKVMTLLQHIDAPAEAVYQLLIDLPERMRWIEGIQALEFRDKLPKAQSRFRKVAAQSGCALRGSCALSSLVERTAGNAALQLA